MICVPWQNITSAIAMSESPEVCQFSSTEAISQHSYTISASNLVQRFVKGLGTVASTNYVKISALVKNTWTFSSYFVIFLCNFEVITGFILLFTVTCNIRQWTTIFAYQTGCQRRQCRFLIATLIQLLRKCYYLQPKKAVFQAFIQPSAGSTLDIPNEQPSLDWIGNG